jgi:hypothetical protein
MVGRPCTAKRYTRAELARASSGCRSMKTYDRLSNERWCHQALSSAIWTCRISCQRLLARGDGKGCDQKTMHFPYQNAGHEFCGRLCPSRLFPKLWGAHHTGEVLPVVVASGAPSSATSPSPRPSSPWGAGGPVVCADPSASGGALRAHGRGSIPGLRLRASPAGQGG